MRLRFILPLLIALLWPAFALGAFTEFYCNYSTGSNMNGGSDTNTSPSYSATNGGWNSGTGVFTPTSGNPSASGVSVGQFAHVFADGSTTPTFIGRVTSVNSTTVTVSTTVKVGTAPGTSGTGISINVGGVWKGPNGTNNFPFGLVTGALVNSSSDPTFVNFKNNATYFVTAAIAHNVGTGTVHYFSGYTSTVRDGGRAVIDGGTSGASYALLTVSNNAGRFLDFEFQNNGATGNADGVTASTANIQFERCKFANFRGQGLVLGIRGMAFECEITGCNQSNTANAGALRFAAGADGARAVRCYIHDNTGSNTAGIYSASSNVFIIDNCIVDTNGGIGISLAYTVSVQITGTEVYNNTSTGIYLSSASGMRIENCNVVKNGGYGIEGNNTSSGHVFNMGYSAGTQANTSGKKNGMNWLIETGAVDYANDVTPWNDPANGDFTITLAAAKGAGRGPFATGLTSTVGYPDIGAAQHQDSGGGGVSRARVVNPRD